MNNQQKAEGYAAKLSEGFNEIIDQFNTGHILSYEAKAKAAKLIEAFMNAWKEVEQPTAPEVK